MQNQPDPETRIQSQPQPHPTDTFSVEKKFPGLGSPPETPAPARTPRPERSLASRLILPVTLFVLAIAGIAWVTQYLPNWRSSRGSKGGVNPGPEEKATALIEFLEFRPDPDNNAGLYQAVWDPKDLSYTKEFERGTRGHYDFKFKNISDKPVELGLLRTSCDCSKVEVAVFPEGEWSTIEKTLPEEGEKRLSWQALKTDPEKGVVVSPGHRGLLRLSWEGRKGEGERLRLGLDLWAQPKDTPSKRDFPRLETMVVLVSPVRFLHERLPFEVLAPRDTIRKEFVCWSSTRPQVKLSIQDTQDPLFVSELTPLGSAERQQLQDKLKDEAKINTRVLSGFKVNVTVREQHEGKQLDQGSFERQVSFLLDGQPLEPSGPVIHGTVQGDVQVGSPEDRGRVQLRNFQAREGIKKKFFLMAPKQVSLEPVSQNPPYVSIVLEKQPKESTATRTRWMMEVSVPPGSPAGPFSPDSVIILRIQGPIPRLLRIPLTGNAGQG